MILWCAAFLSAFCPPCRYEETVIYAESGGEQFVARGKVMIDEGFRQVQEMNCEDEDESSRDMKIRPFRKSVRVWSLNRCRWISGKEKPRRRHDLLKQHCFRQWKIR